MIRSLLCVVACLLCCVLSAGAQEDVGMACFVKGQPQVSGGSTFNKWAPLRLMKRLQAGDKIRCDAASEVIVVMFGKGERYKVSARGQATVEKQQVAGAVSLGALKGASEQAARLLTGAPTGALVTRAPVPLSRPNATYPGWLLEGERGISWVEVSSAAEYVFSIYDSNDVLLWSVRTKENRAEIPAGVPLKLRRPYEWRRSALLANGLPARADDYRWGVITVLTPEDVRQLKSAEDLFNTQKKQNPKDSMPYLLMAERYREFGVLTRAWETIADAFEAGAIDDPQQSQAFLEILHELNNEARFASQQHEVDQTSGAGDK